MKIDGIANKSCAREAVRRQQFERKPTAQRLEFVFEGPEVFPLYPGLDHAPTAVRMDVPQRNPGIFSSEKHE